MDGGSPRQAEDGKRLMTINVTCNCGKKYNLPDSAAGNKATCKKCGYKFTVEASQDSQEIAEEQIKTSKGAPPIIKRDILDSHSVDNSIGVAKPPSAQSPTKGSDSDGIERPTPPATEKPVQGASPTNLELPQAVPLYKQREVLMLVGGIGLSYTSAAREGYEYFCRLAPGLMRGLHARHLFAFWFSNAALLAVGAVIGLLLWRYFFRASQQSNISPDFQIRRRRRDIFLSAGGLIAITIWLLFFRNITNRNYFFGGDTERFLRVLLVGVGTVVGWRFYWTNREPDTGALDSLDQALASLLKRIIPHKTGVESSALHRTHDADMNARKEAWYYYTKVLRNYVGFSGRACRREYWFFIMVNFLMSLLMMFVSLIFESISLWLLYGLCVLIPGIAVTVRRVHDNGRSGWMLFFPIINIVLLVTRGTQGDNQFGPDPQAN